MKIVYTGLREETLNFVTENLMQPEALFLPIPEADLHSSSSWDKVDSADVFLVGENAENPIQITQMVYGYDKSLSIIIVNDAAKFQKIKQSLLFTPFIGPTVYPVSNSAGKGLAAVVGDHIQRTRQRRSYKKFQKSAVANSVPSSEKFERVKTDYVAKILEEAPVGLILINKAGFILSFNRYAGTIFEKKEREVLGTSFSGLFPEKDHDNLLPFLNNISEGNGSKVVEYKGLKSGSRFLEIIMSGVDKDDPSYKIILVNDITEKVLAQSAIEESAQKVNMIVESMPEMAWTASSDGEVDYLNKRWLEFTGQNAGESSGKAWEQAIHPDDYKKAAKLWQKALKKGIPYQLECRYFNASDKSYRWHLTRALPVRSQDGTILQWVGTCTDIQSLKDTEEELQRTAEELAASNEELTAANEEITASMEELSESNQHLTRVNNDLDNFIYTASHDLKAPILNIEGLVRILERKLKSEDYRENKVEEILKMINTSIQRFLGTIGGLTEIVKLQRLSEPESAEIKIIEIIEEILPDLHQQIKDADAQLQILVDKDQTVVFTRRNLKSIIYNLLSNAIKYRSGERKLCISIFTSEEEDCLVLSVKDNGLGMNLKDRNKIFGMFQRMHSHVEGSGIGLYIVKKIIENAGGTISVDSISGKGTTFNVMFPKKIRSIKESKLLFN